VICLDNFITGRPDTISILLEHPRFQLIRCDVTDFIHISGPVDLVLHLASPASPADYLRLPIHTMKVGSIGTLHALGIAREKQARLVLASTSETYGDPQAHPQPESYWGHVNPVGPRGVYDEAKRFAEALTTAYRLTHGVDTAIVRIFNTYGPPMRAYDGRAIPTFIRQALAGEPVTVAGDGSQTRSVCFVDDFITAFLAVAESDMTGPVNVGNPEEMTVLVIARRTVTACASTSPIHFFPRPVDDPSRRRPDTRLIESTLGWRPSVPFDAAVAATIAWFRAIADRSHKSQA